MLQSEQELKLKKLSAIFEQFENETESDFSGSGSLTEDAALPGENNRIDLERLSEVRREALAKVAGSALQKIDESGEINLSFE